MWAVTGERPGDADGNQSGVADVVRSGRRESRRTTTANGGGGGHHPVPTAATPRWQIDYIPDIQ
jgi:hypothetical protein